MTNAKLAECAKILGVTLTDDVINIKKAYRILVKKYHPDYNPSANAASEFHKIHKAYQTLIAWKEKGILPKSSGTAATSTSANPRQQPNYTSTTAEEMRKRRARAEYFKKAKEAQEKQASQAFKKSFFYPLYQTILFLAFAAILITAFMCLVTPIYLAILYGVQFKHFILWIPAACLFVMGLKIRKHVHIPFIRG